MEIQTSRFVNVRAKARDLGCNIPSGITVLPYDFENAESKDDLCYEGVAQILKELFHDNGIVETSLEWEGEEFPSLFKESAAEEWIGPTIFVSFAALSENPHLISIALNVISNYLTDWFKDVSGNRNIISQATLDIVAEYEDGACTKFQLQYKGPSTDLNWQEAGEIIRKSVLKK